MSLPRTIIVLEYNIEPRDLPTKVRMVKSTLNAFGMNVIAAVKADAKGLEELSKFLGVVQEMNSTEKKGEKV